MSYKLHNNVFFKKINDEQVNILLANDDDFIYKLNKVAAKVFLLVAEKNMSEDEIHSEVVALTGKAEAEVQDFLKKFFQFMTEHEFLIKK